MKVRVLVGAGCSSSRGRVCGGVVYRGGGGFRRRRVVVARGLGGMEGLDPRREILASEKLKPVERDAVLSAVEELGSRVTVGDVAKRSGVNVDVAENVLRTVAADAGGALEISGEGDVLYVLPRDTRSILRSKSFAMRLEPAKQKVASVSEYLVRVSFGTALLVSVVVVYSAIFVIATSSQRSDNDNRRGGGPMLVRGFYFNPFDMFWYWDPYYYRNNRVRVQRRGKYNFLEAVFSFVFGDGDPNERYDMERWEGIGRLIGDSNGVVTAEQLAPYLDEAPEMGRNGDGMPIDEAFVLPVLQRFRGVPEVNSRGEILYRFPDFQRSGGKVPLTRGGRRSKTMPGFTLERAWKFSEAESGQQLLAALLGGANLFGVLYLSNMLAGQNLYYLARMYGGVVSLAVTLLPFLQVYAGAFFAIPFLRWLWIRGKNGKIDKRNLTRRMNAEALMMPSRALVSKLEEARKLSQMKVIRQSDIVFKSDESAGVSDLDDFDRKLRE